ncbi:hypothetical protein AB0B45_28705 [Nonomuraea sp. NPDC049152]|uniref:hypothetical protein n=1 Tax=Nonomuraea sp. NPDC049152 TaxID=3154350 RepID=UPI0033DB0A28
MKDIIIPGVVMVTLGVVALLAVAVLLDAVVVRVLIPAASLLLGRRSWWPGPYSSRLAVSGENAGRQTATYSAPSGPTL